MWRPGELARPITWRRRLDGVARRRRRTSVLVAAGRHLVVSCFWCCWALVLDALRWTRCGVGDAGAAFRGRGAIDFSHPAHSGMQSPLPPCICLASLANVLQVGPIPSRSACCGVQGSLTENTRTFSKFRRTQNARHARASPQTALYTHTRVQGCHFYKISWLQGCAGATTNCTLPSTA